MAVHNECELGMEIRDAPPAHLLLKIESFSKLSDHGIENHKSREFLAGTYKWRLVIHPQSNDVSVFLSVAETEFLPEGWEIKADCCIFLHNQISDNYFCFRSKARSFDAKNLKWGVSLSNRMLAELFNGFLVDDNCTFGAEVFVSEPRVSDSLSLLDWKISNFSKLDDVWVSEVFRAGGFQWKLKLHPNGFGVSEEIETPSR